MYKGYPSVKATIEWKVYCVHANITDSLPFPFFISLLGLLESP